MQSWSAPAEKSESWIGGVQVFLNFCTGAITGKIFDKGYLYAMIVPSTLLVGY